MYAPIRPALLMADVTAADLESKACDPIDAAQVAQAATTKQRSVAVASFYP